MADEIWQYRMGGNLTIFDKDHDTAEKGGLPEVKFLQPSMGVRYDCSRARVPKRNNIFLRGHIAVLELIAVKILLIIKPSGEYYGRLINGLGI